MFKKIYDNADYLLNVDSDTGHRRSWGQTALIFGAIAVAAIAAFVYFA